MKIYDETLKIDIPYEPLFFGSGKNLQRYDIMKHKFFYDLGEKMDENFWKPAEISLDQDVLDFKNLTDSEKRIFTLNLKRQIVLDSIQGRSPIQTFGRVCTNSAFESAITKLQFQEVNHSDSYSYILRNVYDNPADVFDTILEDEVITRHTKSITDAYEDFYVGLADWEVKVTNGDVISDSYMFELKKKLWKALIAWNIIEGIRFFVSFACTFAFAENKKMTGNAQELKLIARDEIVHLQLTQKAINILKQNEDENFLDVIKECEAYVTQMYKDAAQNEIEWAEYLFEEGSIIGLNADILTKYMKHVTNIRLRAIREAKLFEDVTNNPLPWIDTWLGQGREEVLPQEIEITDYKIGILTDINDDEWSEIL